MTSGPRELWFLRHGQSEGNVVRDVAERQGATSYDLGGRDADVRLSEAGREQARTVGRWIASTGDEAPTAMICSPYARARETAAEVVAALPRRPPVAIDERLRDRELGVLEGLTWRGVRTAFPQEAERAVVQGRYYHRPPGGESWADMLLRIRSALRDLTAQSADRNVLVVAHDLVVQLARAVLEGLDEPSTVELVERVPYANCALSIYSRNSSGGYDRLRWNWTGPLDGTPPPR